MAVPKPSELLEHPFLSRRKITRELNELQYTILDIETTGLYPEKSEIIEIGAIKTNGVKAIDVFTTLIEPDAAIPNEIEVLTGISGEMTLGKPKIKKALADFMDFIKDDILIAHYSDFDIPFIKHHLQKSLGREMKNKVLCTMRIARSAVPGIKNYKLHTLAEHLGVPVLNRHRAMGDCETTYNVWIKLMEVLKKNGIKELDKAEALMQPVQT